MSSQSTHLKGLKLTDDNALRIVEHYRQQVGDAQSGKTLARLILAAFAAGVRLSPDVPEATPAQRVSASSPPAAAS